MFKIKVIWFSETRVIQNSNYKTTKKVQSKIKLPLNLSSDEALQELQSETKRKEKEEQLNQQRKDQRKDAWYYSECVNLRVDIQKTAMHCKGCE